MTIEIADEYVGRVRFKNTITTEQPLKPCT